MKYILVLFIGLGLIYSCRFIGGKKVRGNGNVETEQRSLPSFDGLTSFGAFDIIVKTGDKHSAVIEADENLMQYVITEVDGDKLKISTRKGYNLRPTSSLKVIVTAPHYNELSSHGSGNIQGEDLITSPDPVKLHLTGSGNINVDMNAPSVNAQIAGSGNITVSGSSKEFSSSIHGSGDIRAGNLKAEDGDVEIAGSGNVEVYASNKLKVNIMGSGGVKYRGDAQINTNIAGSGSVTKVN